MKRYAALSILFSACALPAGDVDSVTSPIIYGTDDRLEVFEAPRADANLARQSVAVMIDSRDIDRRLGLIDGVPLRTRRNRRYCDDQPFLDQPQVGSCSGTLIDGDLFVTAGHCMGLSTRTTLDGSAVPVADVRAALARKCDTTAVIFNHVNEAGGWTAPDRDRDIFYCHEVLVHSFVPTPAEGPSQARFDVTVFSLKRSRTGTRAEPVFQPYAAAPIPSSPRTISPIATSPAGTTLLGIGGPEGLPLKIKRSPLLTTEGDLWVRTLLDVNGGDSGGGVFLQIGGTWTHIGVASHFTHPRFYCPGDEQEEGGSYCARNDGAPDECRTEAFHSGESNLYNTGHSMTHRAYDVLCGGAPAQGMIGPASRYSGFICGTGPRVSPVPFVPRTPDTEPDPPTNTDGGGGGCSTSDAGSSGALLVLLVLGLRRRRLRHGVATSMLALMLACSGDSDPTGEPPTGEPPTTEPPTTEPPATETPRHPTDPDESLSHAVSQLQLPGSRDEFGWDLDGDGSVDAAMGELVELTSSLGITLDDYLRGAIEGGRLQVLLDSTVKDGEVLVLGYQGVDGERIEDVVDNFYRHGDAPIGVLVGSIDEERNVEARGEGSFEFRMRLTDLDGLEIVLPVDAARFEGQVGGFLVEGTLGGAVPVASLAEGVFEPLASYINTLIAADDGCPENCDRRSLGLALILIDGDGDGSVSADELAGYEPLQERLAPDIDLDEDGTPDAISIALRVSAVRANLFQ